MCGPTIRWETFSGRRAELGKFGFSELFQPEGGDPRGSLADFDFEGKINMNRSKFAAALLLGTALSAFCAPAMAEEEDGFTTGSIMLRVRGLGIIADTSNSSVDFDKRATQSLLGRTSLGGNIDASSTVVPEVDASYFFTPNIAVELIAATARTSLSLQHSSGVTKANNVLNNGSNDSLDLGNTMILPPTITAQWHFFPNSMINPYVGAGLNYTWFYDIKGGSANGGNLKLSPTLGYALQAGVDVQIQGRWYGNFDVKKLFIETNAHSDVTGGGIAGGVGTLSVTQIGRAHV